MKVVGLIGSSALGKSAFVEDLIHALRFDGWSVSTIKRAPDGSTWTDRALRRRPGRCTAALRSCWWGQAPVLMRVPRRRQPLSAARASRPRRRGDRRVPLGGNSGRGLRAVERPRSPAEHRRRGFRPGSTPIPASAWTTWRLIGISAVLPCPALSATFAEARFDRALTGINGFDYGCLAVAM
jgi:hypothetical protein